MKEKTMKRRLTLIAGLAALGVLLFVSLMTSPVAAATLVKTTPTPAAVEKTEMLTQVEAGKTAEVVVNPTGSYPVKYVVAYAKDKSSITAEKYTCPQKNRGACLWEKDKNFPSLLKNACSLGDIWSFELCLMAQKNPRVKFYKMVDNDFLYVISPKDALVTVK